MRHLLYTLFFLGIGPWSLLAQSPVVSYADYFSLPIGSGWKAEQTENFAAGPAGADVEWDFSDLNLIGNVINYNILDPTETPFLDSFPTANYALFVPDSSSLEDEFSVYQYYRLDPTAGTQDFLGIASIINPSAELPNGDTIYQVYTDPITYGPFPFRYEDTRTDVSSSLNTVEFGTPPMTLTTVSSREAVTQVDGYGTLITPAGTFPNTLRMRIVTTTRDSIIGTPVPVPVQESVSTTYIWIAENEPTTLLQVDSIPIVGVPGQMVQVTGFYRSSVGTVTSARDFDGPDTWQLTIAPNPVTENRIRYSFDQERAGEITVSVYDQSGREWRRVQRYFSAGTVSDDIAVEGMPAGIYYLVLSGKYGATRTTVVKR